MPLAVANARRRSGGRPEPRALASGSQISKAKVKARRSSGENGSALIEFLLVSVFLVFPLLLGTAVFGLSLVRANQVSEVCRDAGHMYAYNVDFSQASSQNMLVQMAKGLNMTTSGGNGVIILSTVTYVAANDCAAAGLATGNCTNVNNTVVVRRIVIGNPQLHASAFGTPSASLLDSEGKINTADYLTNASAVAANFSDVIPLSSGQYAYMAEAFVTSPDFNFFRNSPDWSWIMPGVISARSIF